MSIPPDRISVKRRREEAPIETFFLEESNRAKRRLTGQTYHFKLLKSPLAPVSRQEQQSTRAVSTPAAKPSTHGDPGIPSVRTTAHGDEIADFTRIRQQQQQQQQQPSGTPAKQLDAAKPTTSAGNTQRGQDDTPKRPALPDQARRFHLTRDLSSSHKPIKPVGVRKQNSRSRSLRPVLPTFVERQALDELYAKPPVDRIVKDKVKANDENTQQPSSEDTAKEAVEVPTFVKPKKALLNSGFSIDHPSATWNRESDQLADELAALAMEFDPDLKVEASKSPSPTVQRSEPEPSKDSPRPTRVEDEYVYETYVRMTDDDLLGDTTMTDATMSNVGVLVIDEEDEDLWEDYMQSDEDSDYDDEDSNAEDNPANDYPDEELSSDDEFSRNPYRYHREHGYGDDDNDDDDDYP